MAAKYRIEEIAPTPRGWHVRTTVRKRHQLRIAYPPGRRRKGSGKVIEILHPRGENPCPLAGKNPAELILMGANPSSAALDRAGELYEKFHGRPPGEVIEMQEADVARKTYTALGDLVELRIRPARGGAVLAAGFDGQGVLLASSPGGKQLYCVGAPQNLDSVIEKFAADATKDFIDLGEAVQVTYRASKWQTNHRSSDWYHDFGEEGGSRPRLMYDRRRQRIYFIGGAYRVEAPGIIN